MLIEAGLIGFTGWVLAEMIDAKQLFKYGMSEFEFNRRTKGLKNPNYTFILGYDEKGENLIWDTKVFPSLSITGVSNCGKSCLTTYLMKKSNMPIVLCNAYKDDYTGIDCTRIEEIEKIEEFIDYLLNVKTSDEPLLVVFDEMLTLMTYPKIAKKVHTLLTKNRHKQIFIIALFQELNKSLVPFKSLFTARLVMRQIQKSDIDSALGVTIEDYKPLQNREFILLSDDIYYGRTFDVEDNNSNRVEVVKENTTAAVNDVIEALDGEVIEEVEVIEEIKEVEPGVQEQALDLNYVAMVQEEIKNKPLSELIKEVDNVKEVKKPIPKKSTTKRK